MSGGKGLRRHGCFCCACDDLSGCWSYYWPKIRCASACSWAFVGDTGERLNVVD